MTTTNFMGLGPEEMLPTNEVWLLAKSQTPLVLRPDPSKGTYTYIGDAFALLLMDGEALDEGIELQRVMIE